MIFLDASVLLAAEDCEDANHRPAAALLRGGALATLELAAYEVTNVADAPRSRWSWFTGPIGMRLRLRLSRVDAVHITDPRAFSHLPVRTLTTVYDLIPLLDPDWNRTNREWRAYKKYLDRLGGAAGIFAISNQTASDLRQHLDIPPPPVQVAPPGVTPTTEVRCLPQASRHASHNFFTD